MKLLITYLMTNFNAMKNHWKTTSALKDKGIVGTDKPIGKDIDLGGLLVEIDWNSKRIERKKKLRSPSGFDYKDGKLYVASMRDNEIYVVDEGFNVNCRLQHPCFNDLHSLNATKKGLLVTSTGLDTILEIDFDNRMLFKWVAVDNGYSANQFGDKRNINWKINHCKTDYPTLFQTTHINSAIYADNFENEILASLFHQGEIVRIECETGKVTSLLNGLKNPHSIYSFNDNYMAADTNNNCVVIFDKTGKIINKVCGSFDWIQDAITLSNNSILIADSNNSRLVEVDTYGREISVFEYPKNWKIYQVKEVNK